MKELEYYYSELFKKAEQFEKWRKNFLIVVLCLLSGSLYASGLLLYIFATSAMIIQTFSLFLGIESNKFKGIANDFQKYSMLIGVFEHDVDVQEIASLKVKAGNTINKIVRNKKNTDLVDRSTSYTTEESEPINKLLEMIQENSYWNNNLYEFSYKAHRTKIFYIVGMVLISVLVLLPSLKLDSDFTILRLLFTVISFGIVYEFIEAMMKYKMSSREMEEIDQKISRLDSIQLQELLNIFSKYHLIKVNTPPIPKKIYNENSEMLNQAWAIRAGKA